MPKHNFMISKAVDLVARKLAGMDPDAVARLTQALSEEAQMISEDLQRSGQNIDTDILAARLDGMVTRMKYEVRNQGPDPSPNEFPIFNVSHNPSAPYPNPINHLYDKRYKEAYSTFIKQNQPPTANVDKREPSSPAPTSPAVRPSPPAYPTYQQAPPRQEPNNPPTQSPAPPAGVPAGFRQQSNGGWQYVNPYATMPRSHAAYYQQQAGKAMPSIPEQQSVNNSSSTGRVRRSSTGEDLRPPSITRSVSTNEINYPQTSGAEQIRVRVINSNASPSSGDSTNSAGPRTRINSQRSILKASNDSDSNNESAPTRRIYAPPNTDIGTETMEDIFKAVNKQRPGPARSSASPMTERVIVIDRRGSESQDDDPNGAGKNRFRTFEIRSPSAPPTPTTPQAVPAVAPSPTPNVATLPAGYTLPQTTYYTPQQFGYQQPKMYSSVPNNIYSGATPYGGNANRFYPFVYYRY